MNTDQGVIADPAAPADPTAPAVAPRGPRARRLAWLGGAVAAGWLVSGVASLLHIDVVLLPLLVLAVATVLRAGRTVLDRLMLSAFVVAGAVVTAGLLFSLWPWGLAPFPVAGTLFTAVALVAGLSGRRPRLPRGFLASDLVVVGTGLFVFLASVRPLLHRGELGRFAFSTTSEDRAAHFALFDTIHRLGSYPFFVQEAARVPLRTPAEATYPTGSHFLYAMIDTFVRSSTDPGAAMAALNRYVLLILAGFAFFVMAVIWAARWIIIPLVGGWRQVAAVAGVAAVLVAGPMFTLVTASFDSQVLGTAFVGFIAAVAIRPTPRLGERLLLLGLGTILTAYVYYLYLPIVAIIIGASFVVDRARLRRHWRVIAGTALVVGAISVVPLYFTATSTLDLGKQALADGWTMFVGRSELIAATAGGLAVLVLPGALRQRRYRTIALMLPALLAFTLVFGAYQLWRRGTTSYYFEKLLLCYLVIGIICSATLVTFLRPIRPATLDRRRAAVRELAAGVLVTVLAVAGLAGLGVGNLTVFDPDRGTWGRTPLGTWYAGRRPASAIASENVSEMAHRGLLGDGTTTLFLVSDVGYENWRLTFVNGVLNRNNGAVTGSVDPMLRVAAGATPVDPQKRDTALAALGQAVDAGNRPLRIVVRDRQFAAAIEAMLTTKGAQQVTVVIVPGS